MSPVRAKRPCTHPGCPELVDKGRCPEHRRQDQQQRDTKTPEERRFYSSARWQAIRADQLRREPLCRDCKVEGRVTIAKVADHVTPRRQGGSDDPSNLQSQCWRHHQRKRQQERGG
jgi:5-methylcytosine-specific restriction protein A